jgi:cell division protein FtsW
VAQRAQTDWILFTTILIMMAGGMLVLWSASSVIGASPRYGSSYYFVIRQAGWAAVAIPLMLVIKSYDYRKLNSPAWVFPTVLLVLVLLAAVYKLDPRLHRWFRLGPAGIQPSELAKPVLILFMAFFVARRALAINNRYTLLPASLIVGLVAGAVMVADVGTAMVLAVTAAVVLLVAGLEWRYLAAAGSVLIVFLIIAIVMKPYRIARIFGFFDPDYSSMDSPIVRHFDPPGKLKALLVKMAPTQSSDYHIRQSLIAVGSGGPLGRGLMRSRQKLLYLPEAHTDFIFAVLAEELGLWGTMLTVSGFVIILWRGLRIYFRAADDFGKYLALGVTTMIVVQAFMNMSVVVNLVPTKGIPLPLISYGGSSLCSTLISLGLLQSVQEHSA